MGGATGVAAVGCTWYPMRMGAWRSPVLPIGLVLLLLGAGNWYTGWRKMLEYQSLLERGVAPGLPEIRGDAAALRRALANLVANAVKFAVGGAPLTTTYAKHIGADGYAADAILTVEMANHLMKGEQSYMAAMQDKK